MSRFSAFGHHSMLVTGPQGAVELEASTSGALAEQHEVGPVESLASGEYRVVWRGIAEDGHSMSGDYRFTVE
jgi:copper resistance protein C